MLSNKLLKTAFKYIAPIALLGWGLYASKLLFDTGNMYLLFLYQVYMAYLFAVAYFCRNNIMHPIGISTLLGFISFGNNIPLFSQGLVLDFGTIPSPALADTMTVFLFAQFAFAAGALINIGRLPVFKLLFDSKFEPVKVGFAHLLALILFVAVAGAFRVHFHIGAAKEFSSLPFTGYFHYALLDGLLFCCLWFLGQSFKRSLFLTFVAFVPLLGLVATQALLGWRGMIFRVTICVMVVFWFQKQLYRNERIRSFAWVILIAVLGFSGIRVGQERRAQISGTAETFASSSVEFVERVLWRSQGTTRLVNVIDRFGNLQLTNDWRIFQMFEKGETSTEYVNTEIYGVQSHQKHSVGASGPGCVYIATGLVGIVMAYFLWGMLYRAVFQQINFQANEEHNVIAIAFYATLIDILFYTYSEAFGVAVLKKLIAITCIALFCKIYLFSSRKLKRTKSPTIRNLSRGPKPYSGSYK